MRRGVVLLLALSLCACGGGGGHSPSEPTINYPTMTGSWSGSWFVTVSGVTVRFFLTPGSRGHFTGTFTSLSSTFDIEGDATTDLRFTWRALNSGCGTLTGSGQIDALNAFSMVGPIDLNTTACAGGTRFLANAIVGRTSSAPAADAQRGTIEDLALALRGASPR